jgi:hypothetical protein
MIRRALLAAIGVAAFCPATYANSIQIWVDADHSTYLYNATLASIALTGYGIESPEKLAPSDWRSIADWTAEESSAVLAALGPNALGFQEITATDFSIAEANAVGSAIIHPGEKLSIGRLYPNFGEIFASSGYYTVAGSDEKLPMQHSMPEPSTWLLAVLAGVGVFVFRRRLPAQS